MSLSAKLDFYRLPWGWFNFIWLYLVILLWHVMTDSNLNFIVAAWLFSLLLVSLLIGDLVLKWALRDNEKFNNLPTKLLTGGLLVNVSLFIEILALPFHLAVDWIILLISVVILWLGARRAKFTALMPSSHGSEIIFFLVIPLAITVWCRELLHPIEFNSDIAVIRAWQDVYYHLCQISAFASSQGIATISDVQMVGAAVHPYHMASYMLPAVLVNITDCSPLIAYASLLVPLGITMSALAAFSLSQTVFGRWPALATGMALILLPDAPQQGFGNPFFGYHWLQQIAPAQSYGVACAALVFMLIIEACRTTQYRLIFLSYFFVLVTLSYKAQIFVAISFPALVLPVLLMRGKLVKFRVPSLLVLSCLYIGVLMLSQISPNIPTIRLDGSGLMFYSSSILNTQADGFIKQALTPLFTSAGNNWYLRAGVFLLMLIICTFGILPLVYAFILRHVKNNFKPEIWSLPLIVMFIYLIMATCLATDDRHIGNPEELLHRPFVWAYFVLVVWCAGASYHYLFRDALPTKNYAKFLCLVLVLILTVIPIHFSKGIQTFKTWGLGYQELPVCQIEVAKFIKTNSHINEVVQDSMNDRHFILSALSERKPFAIDSGGVRMPSGMQPRLNSLGQLKELVDSNLVKSFMKKHSIKWYVINPTDHVNWPETMRNQIAFECHGYVVYHF